MIEVTLNDEEVEMIKRALNSRIRYHRIRRIETENKLEKLLAKDSERDYKELLKKFE